MPKTNLAATVFLVLLAGVWAFVAVALGAFSPADWPTHAVPNATPADVTNPCGPVGSMVAYAMTVTFGAGAWVPLIAIAGFITATLAGRRIDQFWLRFAGVVLLTIVIAVTSRHFSPGSFNGLPEGNGGTVGIAIESAAASHFGSTGLRLGLLMTFMVGMLLAADDLVLYLPKLFLQTVGLIKRTRPAFANIAERMPSFPSLPALPSPTDFKPVKAKVQRLKPKRKKKELPELEEIDNEDVVAEEPNEIDDADETADEVEEAEDESAEVEEEDVEVEDAAGGDASDEEEEDVVDLGDVRAAHADIIVRMHKQLAPPPKHHAPVELGDYTLPGWEALADPEVGFHEQQQEQVREKAAMLEQALRDYGVDSRVVSIDTGPVITVFAISLSTGTKVSAITSLSNDIARALAAETVRVVAPIPGTNYVGIEVPNDEKEKVRLKELMHAAPEKVQKMLIPLYLGKDSRGEPLITDLTAMPHCLIAGTTGSGKSVCINSIIMSIMYTQRPDMVKLILVDPKVVEMAPFKDIPHLMCPVITESAKATSVLEWACEKMDERYAFLAEAGVRNIASYNKLTREELIERFNPENPEEEARIPKFLPYIVIIIDELADLMMTSGKEVESCIVRIAQKARAVGIHLILATQRPQATVVTGLIKANMPSKIAFRVASKMDSRIVLDQNGADLLLGQGDMLFLPPGASRPNRSQGTYIDDKEIRGSVSIVKTLAAAQYEPELVQIKAGIGVDEEAMKDDLFENAVRVVLETKRGSVSLLQRRLTIGYARASRLIEAMATAGIVGDYKGSQAREAQITVDEWEAMKSARHRDADDGMSV